MNRAVIFGAGNIGRSFIGNIFSSNGYHITFIDANIELVKQLNTRKQYPIIIKRNNKSDEKIYVKNIEAIHSSETDKIVRCIIGSNICATSVGQGALPKVIPILAKGIKAREKASSNPFDIIIAENIRNGADYFRKLLKENGLAGDEAGLVETSIGKMVPIMRKSDLLDDPLVLNAEEYNTLILDGNGFKNKAPSFPEVKVVKNIAAWVDRKLFIHNLGHAASAYIGFEKYPSKKLIADILEDGQIRGLVKNIMNESAAALLCEYPDDFTKQDLENHIDDLIYRFRNKALGDTVYRVGRDLPRKLNQDDRIFGAVRLCIKHDLPYGAIIKVFHAALNFRARNQNGEMYLNDKKFFANVEKRGIKNTLMDICNIDNELIGAALEIPLNQRNTPPA